ncbi:hypothetical protein GCK32_000166 [Trichostrongylus colubriformis]|uniref:Uncharacterized protein n=1 Tax=Trichostrongylus colubriformis TaxID=6319 RepID=A0AAN8FZ60_TRICO
MDNSGSSNTVHPPALVYVDYSSVSGFSPTNMPAPPPSGISGASKTTSSSYDSSFSSSFTTSPSSADRKALSDQNLFGLGEQSRMVTMISFMKQLAITDTVPSTSARTLGPNPLGAHQQNTRSASGHQRTPCFPQSHPGFLRANLVEGLEAREPGVQSTRPVTSCLSASSSTESPLIRRDPAAKNPPSRSGCGFTRVRPSPQRSSPGRNQPARKRPLKALRITHLSPMG